MKYNLSHVSTKKGLGKNNYARCTLAGGLQGRRGRRGSLAPRSAGGGGRGAVVAYSLETWPDIL